MWLRSSLRAVRVQCRAKLNLVLEILGRRPDGFHDLVTVIHPVALADELTVSLGGSGIELTTSGLPSPTGEGNIVFRATQRFLEATSTSLGVQLSLHKRIPAKSGLGGGSSDAAGALLGLAELTGWKDEAALTEIGRGLGADVPFFLSKAPALAEGIGDLLSPLPPAEFFCALALGTPGVNTARAYSDVCPCHYTDGARARHVAAALQAGEGLPDLYNAFAHVLAASRPDLTALIARAAELVGEGRSGLTGTGSCVFALATSKEAVQQVAETLSALCEWTWWGPAAPEPLVLERLS